MSDDSQFNSKALLVICCAVPILAFTVMIEKIAIFAYHCWGAWLLFGGSP